MLSFLDITITCENNKFVTSVYHKPTFSGVFTNFESFIPEMHKHWLIETLFHRSFRLCSSYENFHQEIETLNSIFPPNSYPQNFVNQFNRNVNITRKLSKYRVIFGPYFSPNIGKYGPETTPYLDTFHAV